MTGISLLALRGELSSKGHTSPSFLACSALAFGAVWLAIRSRRACEVAKYGQGWIRTSEGISQQIYSLPRLAASVPTRNEAVRGSLLAILGLRFRTALNS